MYWEGGSVTFRDVEYAVLSRKQGGAGSSQCYERTGFTRKRYHVQDLQLLVNRFGSGVHSTSEASVSVVKFSQVAKIPLRSKIKKQIIVEQSKDDLLRPGCNHFCPAECLCGWMTGIL